MPSVCGDVVRIDPPPPHRRPSPIYIVVPTGASLIRIFDPSRRYATPLTFRSFGPLFRFDHHRRGAVSLEPRDDPDRAVYYAAWSGDVTVAISSALVEVFGDTREVNLRDYVIASPIVTRDLHLLDLRGRGAMLAGTVAAISKCDHLLSQPWSCFIYDRTEVYDEPDGLLYANAHNDEPAVMLYERARGALNIPDYRVTPLHHPDLDDLLTRLMLANGLE